MEASAFSLDGHDHDVDYLAVGGKAADSELLDGNEATDFAAETETTPFAVTIAEGESVPVFQGVAYGAAVRCEDFGENPDHKVTVRVTSTVAWYIDDSTEHPIGFGDVANTVTTLDDQDFVIWSDHTSEALIVEVHWASAETTGNDCAAYGKITWVPGSGSS